MTTQTMIDECLADIRLVAELARAGGDVKHIIDRISIVLDALVGLNVRPDTGPWLVSKDGRSISSNDFTHDVTLRVTGDFWSDEQRAAYATELASRLSRSPLEQLKVQLRKIEKTKISPHNEFADQGYQLDDEEQKALDAGKALHGTDYMFEFSNGSGIGTAVTVKFKNGPTIDITNYKRW